MNDIQQLRFWTYKILPLVYDDSLSYYEVLAKVSKKLNEVITNVNEIPDAIKETVDSDELAQGIMNSFAKAIATNEGEATYTATAKEGGELIWLNNVLYEVTAPMAVGTNYVVGSNISPLVISDELNHMKGYLSDMNEFYHERSGKAYDTGLYLYYKDNLYITTKDIAVNDILYTDGENQNLKEVTLGDEITKHYTEMHEADNNLQNQIDGNDGDIEKLQTNANNLQNQITSNKTQLNNRIDNIVGQSGTDNTEIVDARTWSAYLSGQTSNTLGNAIRGQIDNLIRYTPVRNTTVRYGTSGEGFIPVGDVGTTVDLSARVGTAGNYLILTAKEGDIFIPTNVNVSAEYNSCAYLDSNNVVLAVGSTKYVAPPNTAKYIANSNSTNLCRVIAYQGDATSNIAQAVPTPRTEFADYITPAQAGSIQYIYYGKYGYNESYDESTNSESITYTGTLNFADLIDIPAGAVAVKIPKACSFSFLNDSNERISHFTTPSYQNIPSTATKACFVSRGGYPIIFTFNGVSSPRSADDLYAGITSLGNGNKSAFFPSYDSNVITIPTRSTTFSHRVQFNLTCNSDKIYMRRKTSDNANWTEWKPINPDYTIPTYSQTYAQIPQPMLSSNVEKEISTLRGFYLTDSMSSPITDMKETGTDIMVHVPTFKIINNVVYATYYTNKTRLVEDPTQHTAKFCYFNLDTPTEKTFMELQTVGDTFDGKTVTAIYDTILMTLDNDVLYLMWTAKLDNDYARLYQTYTISSNVLSEIKYNTFTVSNNTENFTISNMNTLLTNANQPFTGGWGDIGIMQAISPRVENEVTYYYTGCYTGNFTCIIKSNDLINWTYVAQPTFTNKNKYENAVWVHNNTVYYAVRQEDTCSYQILTTYNLDSNTWGTLYALPDCQSRCHFFEYNNVLYLAHAPTNRNHIAIMRIDYNNLALSYDIEEGYYSQAFYPYIDTYDSNLYMAFTQNRQHIYLCKIPNFTPNSSILYNKLKGLIKE